MRIANVIADKNRKTMIKTFGGYDRRNDSSKGSFTDMKNMSSKAYPKIKTRDKRAVYTVPGKKIYGIESMDIYCDGEIRKNALIIDCENRLKAVYEENGEKCEKDLFNTSNSLKSEGRTFVQSGTKLYFFPDKVAYDFMDSSVSSLEFKTQYALGVGEDGYLHEFAFEPCSLSGEDADESSPYRRMRRRCYKIKDGVPSASPDKYLSFSNSIREGDTVSIRGLDDPLLHGSYNIKTISLLRDMLVVECDRSFAQRDGTVYLERTVPEMDFVISAGNRLWGCRYGTDEYGNCVNEIYASALGDPTNWNKFEGVSTDSWTASVGAAGSFTGAVCMNGRPVFFKEDTIIKVFGDTPFEYTVSQTQARGIEAGSAQSAVFVHDDLYYKTYSGIVRYDGGLPVNIDAPLGEEKYKKAVAGTADGKYYISMENDEGIKELFVYDTQRRLWHKEDTINILSFARAGAELYFLSEDEGESRILSVRNTNGFIEESDFDWFLETVPFGTDIPEYKYVSEIQIRAECGGNTDVCVYISYNGEKTCHFAGSFVGLSGSRLLRIRPRRCDSFSLRFEGTGEFTLGTITQTVKSSGTADGTFIK